MKGQAMCHSMRFTIVYNKNVCSLVSKVSANVRKNANYTFTCIPEIMHHGFIAQTNTAIFMKQYASVCWCCITFIRWYIHSLHLAH